MFTLSIKQKADFHQEYMYMYTFTYTLHLISSKMKYIRVVRVGNGIGTAEFCILYHDGGGVLGVGVQHHCP